MNPRAETTFYSQEEIKKLPKLKDGRFRKTRDGLWQVRYRRDGYDIQFTSKDKKVVTDKFRDWVIRLNDEKKNALPKKTQLFSEFAKQYFEQVKRVNVVEDTCKTQFRCAELHIFPKIGNLPIRQITSSKLQELLNGILDEGKGRTAESVKFILGEIFRHAVGQKLISENPMKYVKIPNHIRENGKALSSETLRKFFAICEKSKYRKLFMIYLYTGIRRNELHSLRIEGDFVSVVCGKCRKGQKPHERKIPIADALRPFLNLSKEELAVKNIVLTKNFKKICPGHQLNDLRHTFISRCQECKIPKALIDVWTDHIKKKDMTEGVYTHFSAEFQLQEINNLKF